MTIPAEAPLGEEALAENFPGRQVRLNLDLGGCFVWNGRGEGCSGDDLPLDDTLRRDLQLWVDSYLGWSGDTEDTLVPEARREFPHRDFNRRGQQLAQRMQQTLGGDWTVAYRKLVDLTGRGNTAL